MSPPTGKKSLVIILIATVCVVGATVSAIFLEYLPISKPTSHTDGTGNPAMTQALEDLLSKASIERGRMMTHTCIDCHTFDEDGPHRFGPNLFGIFGAHHASKKDFAYSDALKAQRDKLWTEENLYSWLINPKAYAPGTKMGYPGVSSAQDRADIIVYLKTLKAE